MIQRPRTPAILTLLTLLIAGALLLFVRQSSAASESELQELRLAVAQQNAKPETWLQYAQKLQSRKYYDIAAGAYQKYLEFYPNHHDALLQSCLCIALTGNRDKFYAYMDATIKIDPRLSKAVFETSEATPFLNEDRFKGLKQLAIDQSMD